jgi:hypothetical protein
MKFDRAKLTTPTECRAWPAPETSTRTSPGSGYSTSVAIPAVRACGSGNSSIIPWRQRRAEEAPLPPGPSLPAGRTSSARFLDYGPFAVLEPSQRASKTPQPIRDACLALTRASEETDTLPCFSARRFAGGPRGDGVHRGRSARVYENPPARAAPASVNTAHHPKTMANEVPRFTLLTQAKPIAVKASVQIIKISTPEARL